MFSQTRCIGQVMKSPSVDSWMTWLSVKGKMTGLFNTTINQIQVMDWIAVHWMDFDCQAFQTVASGEESTLFGKK